MEIKFEAPPIKNRADDFAAALKSNPGEWAYVVLANTAHSASMANQMRTGVFLACRPAGSFEALSKKVNGEYRVYARFVGKAD